MSMLLPPSHIRIVLGLLLMIALSFAQPTASAGENAAKVYRTAFEAMPNREKLTPAERERLDNFLEAPIDDITSDLLKKYAPVLDRLHQAAAVKDCDWGLLPTLKEKGVMGISFPNHVQHSRALAVAGLLRMRYRIEKGDTKTAFDDLLAVLTLARHAAADGTMIGLLGGIAIEKTAVRATATHLLDIKDTALLKDVLKRFDQLPPALSVAEAIKSEREAQLVWLQSNGKASFKLTDEDLSNIKRLTEETVRIAGLPFDQIGPTSDALDEKVKALPGAVRLFVQGPASMCRAGALVVVEREMFRAAITIVTDGPDQLKRFKDPFGTGPFTYRKTPAGFELQSTIRDGQNRPVTLSVGESE